MNLDCDSRSLIERIAVKRESLGNISLRQTALQIGINATTLLRILNAEQIPSKKTLDAIYTWLNDSDVNNCSDFNLKHHEEIKELVHLRAERNPKPDMINALIRMVTLTRRTKWEVPERPFVKVESNHWRLDHIRLTGVVRQYELSAITIRRLAGITDIHACLDPYELAKHLGLVVTTQNEIPGLSCEDIKLLSDVFSTSWSGVTVILDDERRVVILNTAHNAERKRSTLMEEICHLVFGHTPTSLKNLVSSGTLVRDYDPEQEKEAYWTGAAALVPYLSLAEMVSSSLSAATIAKHFMVSEELVKFRIKTTGLWSKYQNVL